MTPADPELFEFEVHKPAQGYPEFRWEGKRPCTSIRYCPAVRRESYGNTTNSWMNRIYWGDNLRVMGHLLKEFRGTRPAHGAGLRVKQFFQKKTVQRFMGE